MEKALSSVSPTIPIVPAPFTWRNGLVVNDIKRCDSNDLYKLVSRGPGPILTKSGKPRVNQPKEETNKFYQAQFVHYGLRQEKTKDAAKKSLLAAYKGGTELKVPEKTQKLEKDLELQFSIADKEAEIIDHAQNKVNLELRRQGWKRKVEAMRAEFLGAETEEPVATKGRKAKRGKVIGNCVPKSRSSAESTKPNPLDASELEGVYRIFAPEIADQWEPIDDYSLTLKWSSTKSHLWGDFDFGIFEGTLRSNTPFNNDDKTISFLWRGRETGEGETTYGPDNTATLTFQKSGLIGEMY